jgi:hypothetical protein
MTCFKMCLGRVSLAKVHGQWEERLMCVNLRSNNVLMYCLRSSNVMFEKWFSLHEMKTHAWYHLNVLIT